MTAFWDGDCPPSSDASRNVSVAANRNAESSFRPRGRAALELFLIIWIADKSSPAATTPPPPPPAFWAKAIFPCPPPLPTPPPARSLYEKVTAAKLKQPQPTRLHSSCDAFQLDRSYEVDALRAYLITPPGPHHHHLHPLPLVIWSVGFQTGCPTPPHHFPTPTPRTQGSAPLCYDPSETS